MVVAQESSIETFNGTREQRELRMFLDDLSDLWEQRPDLSDEAKSRRTWRLLAVESSGLKVWDQMRPTHAWLAPLRTPPVIATGVAADDHVLYLYIGYSEGII